MKHLPSDSTTLVSFPKRPEYLINSFTLTFAKIEDLTDSTPDVVQSAVAEIGGLASCFPVIKFAVDGNNFAEGAWVLTVSYEGKVYDSKLLYVDNGKPESNSAGSGILNSITIV